MIQLRAYTGGDRHRGSLVTLSLPRREIPLVKFSLNIPSIMGLLRSQCSPILRGFGYGGSMGRVDSGCPDSVHLCSSICQQSPMELQPYLIAAPAAQILRECSSHTTPCPPPGWISTEGKPGKFLYVLRVNLASICTQ